MKRYYVSFSMCYYVKFIGSIKIIATDVYAPVGPAFARIVPLKKYLLKVSGWLKKVNGEWSIRQSANVKVLYSRLATESRNRQSDRNRETANVKG